MRRSKYTIIALLSLLFLTHTSYVYSHPGKTAADGCHYCRTNCDSWGVPWNVRHCHGGGSVQELQPVYIPPTSTPRPLPTWTLVPTKTPTPSPTAIPTKKPTTPPTPTITIIETSAPTAPSPSHNSPKNEEGGLVSLGLIVAGTAWYLKNKR